jgi:hypothetical protein
MGRACYFTLVAVTKISKKQANIISEQAETIKKLEALARELQETIARLQNDSHNSSKPPSSR